MLVYINQIQTNTDMTATTAMFSATIPIFRGFLNARNMDWKTAKAELALKAQLYFKDTTRPHASTQNAAVYKIDNTSLVCFDADDKEANDYVASIMEKHGVHGNRTPSVSNYFKHDEEDNAHKFHYWFKTDKKIDKKIGLNGTKLDILTKEIVFEPIIEGQINPIPNAPVLTDAIHADIMKFGMAISAAAQLSAKAATHATIDDIAFIDANTTAQDATNYATWIKTLIKIANKYGKNERGLCLAHLFSAKASSVYDPPGVNKEWESIQPEKYTECKFDPILQLAGKCHIVLSDSELSDASTVGEYSLTADALLIKGNELRNFDTIARKILPFIRMELRYCNEDWYAFNAETKLWGILPEPQKIIKRHMFKCVLANNAANAQKMATCEQGDPQFESLKALQKEYTTLIKAVESLHNIALVKNDYKVDLNDDDFVKTLDQTAGKLVFSDGIHDIATNTFRKGLTYEDRLSFTLPYAYTVATGQDMARVREEVMKICALDQWRYDYYMQCLGYSLLGRPSAEQVAFFMVGITAGNGKSTLLEALTTKMPQYVVKLNSKTFSKGNGEFKKNINSITGARIAWINEVEKVKQDVDMIKEIADGRAIKNPVLFKQKEDLIQILAKLFFVSNGELAFASCEGIKRRYRYIEFIAKFHTAQDYEELEEKRAIDFVQNKAFEEFLITERGFSALLTLILDGARSWLKTEALHVPLHYRALAKAACEKNEEFAEFVGCNIVKAAGKMLTRFEIEERFAMVFSGKKMHNEKTDFRGYMATKGFIYDRLKKKRVFGVVKDGCYMECALTEANDVDVEECE